MQATIKLTITVDVDDIESTLDSLDYDNDIEIECDEVCTVYGNGLDEQIDFLVLCDSIGEVYSEYCEYHGKYFTETNYNDAYIGLYTSLENYARERYDSELMGVSNIILDSIDWSAVAEALESELVVIKSYGNLELFSA